MSDLEAAAEDVPVVVETLTREEEEEYDVNERVMQLFADAQTAFKEEGDRREQIRSCVRDLEQDARAILIAMEAIHHCRPDDVPGLCVKIRGLLTHIKPKYAALQKLIPVDQYYRYHDFWRFVSQRLSFLSSLLIYLESDSLATRTEVADLMGIHSLQANGFHLDLEDFLQGLLSMATELSRLAVNSVTQGDYQRPFSISVFLTELSSGFRLLNLKNDTLRKKFDALKYDVKKVEGVVYDVTIRGLKPK